MTFEIENSISLKEYILINLKLIYTRSIVLFLLQLYATFNLLFALLLFANFITIESKSIRHTVSYFALFAIMLPFFLVRAFWRLYKSRNGSSNNTHFIFNDEKISYRANDVEASFAWSHFTRYKFMNGFIIFFVGKNTGFLLKANKLTDEQVNFIITKLKEANR